MTAQALASTGALASTEDRLAAARAALAAKPDGVIEAVARQHGVASRDVLAMLPPSEAVFAPAEAFGDIWQDMTGWGEILFIVNTPDIVLECHGTLPPGSAGHGWFNVHGDSPIGGHIKADNCREIGFVDRVFHGRRSCSIQFYNEAGEAMFKVFVRRDDKRELLPEQTGRFEQLRARYA
ncbi:MAG: heme utilization cystosolic carrier protein HutX [Rhizobiales bacterium]|nr:heme utilization cystosolic carrier protein HutX [Hyphomicrobiales bacterium]